MRGPVRFSTSRPALRPRLAAGLLAVLLQASAEAGPPDGPAALPGTARETPATAAPIDFQRDIEPIFRQRCLQCHGMDRREGGLRLTSRQDALLPADSGDAVIVPGSAEGSELFRRIGSPEADRMPPEEAGPPLSEEQIALIGRWIDQGAGWPSATEQKHWAYIAPVRPPIPEAADRAWPKNAIDHFVLQRLEHQGLRPAPAAERAVLVRRVYLDLVGLPPTIEEVDAFIADTRADAYDRLVDRLLASPHYGERWARPWLDLARYADSNGFQRDGFRDVWAYRDWVIDAFNRDMPFDQFTIEQIAGDLLPDATLEQKIASGFHRHPTVNVEAGTDQEENRVNGVIDRVNTTGTVWLGATLACAQCHNHKYDPFSQEEYYRLFAYFNNTAIETALRTPNETAAVDFIGPLMELPMEPEDQTRRRQLERERQALQQELDTLIAEARREQPAWEEQIVALLAASTSSSNSESADPGNASGPPESSAANAGSSSPAEDLPAAIRDILAIASAERTAAQRKKLEEHFLGLQPQIKAARQKLANVGRELEALQPPTTLVMQELDEPRKTHVFLRGNFLSPGRRVVPGVPAVLHPLPGGAEPNRLGLARWLVDPANPLVGRVTVNRWWAEFFGHGLVATLEDFGTQSEPPTHPELLDWLAVEFVEAGWSMKHIHQLIVTSATYQQSSRLTPALAKRDPGNRFYARGPRFRLAAETIRDQALAVSGLLSGKLGGPPVFPPQPEGIWRVTGQVDNTYRTSQGEDRYRRGLYTIWRRSAPYPSFVNFDAPDRSSCVVARPRTNTPLQALTLLNDPVYVEAALALAARVLRERPDAAEPERAEHAFRLCLARPPKPEECQPLLEIYQEARSRFEADPAAARELIGNRAPPPGVDIKEWAAWFYVANVLLNLDEMVTRP